MSTIQEFEAAAAKATQASAQADTWANGPINTTVPTDSGPVPTIAEFTRANQARADAAIDALGWVLAGDFTAGCTVADRNQYVLVVGGAGYRWDGVLPKVVTAGSSPTPIATGAWVLVGDMSLRGDLAASGGSGLVGYGAGTVEQEIDAILDWKKYSEQLQLSRSHKFHVEYKLPNQFSGYSAVIAAGGYNFLYATGHSFDRTANELWIAYQANGGDNAQWYVVYDLTTLAQKTYFKCGVRWTKTFTLRYVGGVRLVYGRASNSYLAAFDVTALPAPGTSAAQYAQPKSNIGAICSSIMAGSLLAAHRGQTTNVTAQFNTYIALDPDTFEHRKVYRLNTVSAGDTDGLSQKMYKTQGLCLHPSGIAISHGGFVADTDYPIKNINDDFRSIQGVAIRTPSGEPLVAGLFDPFKAMAVLSGLGFTVNRFETEGINYDETTGKLTTLWHTDGGNNSEFLIVEAFSANPEAIDLSTCAASVMPNVPEIMSLYRDDQNGSFPHDNITGQPLTNVTDICNMMMRYDQREIIFYTSNFSSLGFNGGTVIGSAEARLFRGNNTTFFFSMRSSGANQKWLITVSGGVFSYTLLS